MVELTDNSKHELLSTNNFRTKMFSKMASIFFIFQVYKNNSVTVLLNTAEKLFRESLWLDNLEKKCPDREHEYETEFLEKSNRSPPEKSSSSSVNSDENESGNSAESSRYPSRSRTSCDPSLATYYLASNMIVQDKEKQQLLEAENTVIRLRYAVIIIFIPEKV